MNTYIKIVTRDETYAMEIKDFTPKPGVSALRVAKDILPPGIVIHITDAKFITRDEYMVDYGEGSEVKRHE